jgi:hypothetical protein
MKMAQVTYKRCMYPDNYCYDCPDYDKCESDYKNHFEQDKD